MKKATPLRLARQSTAMEAENALCRQARHSRTKVSGH